MASIVGVGGMSGAAPRTRLGAGVILVDGTAVPNMGDEVSVQGGVIHANLTDGVVISVDGETVKVDFASPVTAEVSVTTHEVRAKFDPVYDAGLTRGIDGVGIDFDSPASAEISGGGKVQSKHSTTYANMLSRGSGGVEAVLDSGIVVGSSSAEIDFDSPVSAEVSGGKVRSKHDPTYSAALVRGSSGVGITFDSPASAEISGSAVQAKFDPAYSGALVRGPSGVGINLGDGVSVSGGEAAVNRTWTVLDLTAPEATVTPATNVTRTITSVGGGQYDIAVTQNAGTIQDGFTEAVRLVWDIRDANGNVIDIVSDPNWTIVTELEVISMSTNLASILVEVGIATRDAAAGGVFLTAGVTTGAGTAGRSVTTSASTNNPTTNGAIHRIRTTWSATGQESGSYRLMAGKIFCYDSAGAVLGAAGEAEVASQVDATPGTPVIVVKIGTDAAGVLSETVRAIARYIAIPSVPPA